MKKLLIQTSEGTSIWDLADYTNVVAWIDEAGNVVYGNTERTMAVGVTAKMIVQRGPRFMEIIKKLRDESIGTDRDKVSVLLEQAAQESRRQRNSRFLHRWWIEPYRRFVRWLDPQRTVIALVALVVSTTALGLTVALYVRNTSTQTHPPSLTSPGSTR